MQLSRQHPPFHVFRVEDFGAPAYPELIVATTSSLLKRSPSLARGVVHTLVNGYQYVLQHPLDGERDLQSQVSGLSKQAVSQQLQAELPAFLPAGGGAYGALQPSVLNAWAKWEKKFGIVKKTAGRRDDVRPQLPAALRNGPRRLPARPPRASQASRLLSAEFPELFADGFRSAPHLHGLDAACARLAQRQLAVEPGVVEQLQRGVHRRAPRLRGRSGAPPAGANASRAWSKAGRCRSRAASKPRRSDARRRSADRTPGRSSHREATRRSR